MSLRLPHGHSSYLLTRCLGAAGGECTTSLDPVRSRAAISSGPIGSGSPLDRIWAGRSRSLATIVSGLMQRYYAARRTVNAWLLAESEAVDALHCPVSDNAWLAVVSIEPVTGVIGLSVTVPGAPSAMKP